MFRNLRVKRQPEKIVPDERILTAEQLAGDPTIPITLHQINHLPQNSKQRLYRALLPSSLLVRFGIDPVTWKGPGGKTAVQLQAEEETNGIRLLVTAVGHTPAESVTADPFIQIELTDNALNGIDLNWIVLFDPLGPYFRTDMDENGRSTILGAVSRNLLEEERAMRAGLGPGQVRPNLGASRQVFQHLETFLALLGHRALFLEPLTYLSAWVFERRGFAYVRGHRLMDEIHRAFQPGGRLNAALDCSTPFRQPDQWSTVRGRSWAIHDGILETIGARWDGLRMIKQLGRQAGIETFPGAVY